MSVTYRLSRRWLLHSAQLSARAARLLVLMKSILKGSGDGSGAGHGADQSRQLEPIWHTNLACSQSNNIQQLALAGWTHGRQLLKQWAILKCCIQSLQSFMLRVAVGEVQIMRKDRGINGAC